MTRITVEQWQNVRAGQAVCSGFDYDLTAPSEEGMYTLYELVTDSHTHAGWQWVKEV